MASFYSLESPLWAPLHTPANVPGRKLESWLDGRRRCQVHRVLLGGAIWGRLVHCGCVQQRVGGRLVSIESLWLRSFFISATLPAAFALLLASFDGCGVADVRVQRLVVVLRGWPRLETNHCSSSRGERLYIRRCGAFDPGEEVVTFFDDGVLDESCQGP